MSISFTSRPHPSVSRRRRRRPLRDRAGRGACPVCTKTADRVLALPLHRKITRDQVAFIVETLKDASINTGAGAAIYL